MRGRTAPEPLHSIFLAGIGRGRAPPPDGVHPLCFRRVRVGDLGRKTA